MCYLLDKINETTKRDREWDILRESSLIFENGS